jgi:hypothetical protein
MQNNIDTIDEKGNIWVEIATNSEDPLQGHRFLDQKVDTMIKS